MTGGERDLGALLRGMTPVRRPGEFVVVSVPGGVPAGADPLVTVREDEGTTLVLTRRRADELGLAHDVVLAWITLQVHSSLQAVGLTAAVAGALTEVGVSANVVAGAFHDHVLVPLGDVGTALAALAALSARS